MIGPRARLDCALRSLRKWPIARLVVAATILTLLLLTALVVSGFLRASAKVDEAARIAERHRAEVFIDGLERTISSQLKVQLTWDDAIKATQAKLDQDWTDAYIGNFLWNSFGYDPVLLISTRGEPRRGWINGKPIDQQALDRFRPQIARLLPQMAASTRFMGTPSAFRQIDKTSWPIDNQGFPLTKWSTGATRLNGNPVILVAASIMPDTDMRLMRQDPDYVVVVRKIDAKVLAELGTALAVEQVKFGAARPAGSGINAIPLNGLDGEPLGWFSWESPPLNRQLREEMQPLFASYMVFVLLFLAGATTILLTFARTARELSASEAQAKHSAAHDGMTGLANRASLMQRLHQKLEAIGPDQDGQGIVLAYFDLDRFKMVNDTMGHHVGDELVRQVADRLQRELPTIAFLARLGGDEFVMMQDLAGGRVEAECIGKQIVELIARPFQIFGKRLDVTASVGVACAPQDGREPGQLLRLADIAMYEAKKAGRAQAKCYTPEMDASVRWQHEVEYELRSAIAANQIEIAYQPIICASSGQITAVEALLRWQHPQHGSISPAVFVPIAEQAGLIRELGSWVLDRVFAQTVQWPGLGVSINLSPLQILMPDFIEGLQAMVTRHGVDVRRITFEITESVLLEPGGKVFEILEQLRARGFRLSLDDFGTGYSSLSYLQAFRFDQLKIDRSFILHIEDDIDAASILKAVVSLGRSLNMEVVAEGVESMLQKQLVISAGCNFIQGHFHWPALTVAELGRLVVPDLVGEGGKQRYGS